MSESILVGTDGSSAAGAAVQRAIELARAFDRRLLIVSAYAPGPAPSDPDGAADGPPAWEMHARDEALELLAAASRAARDRGIAEVETFARVGDGADAILDVAEEQRCELIVVGHTGRTGATRFLLGSVPNKVSHHAPCSVLIVRSG